MFAYMFLHVLISHSMSHVGVCEASRRQPDLSSSPISTGLLPSLKKIYLEQPDARIEQAIADGLFRAAVDENIDAEEIVCLRDYSILCPEGWADEGDGNNCAAPFGYTGSCGSSVGFGGLDPKGKRNLATKCATSYPCAGSCARDYSGPCPSEWSMDVNHDCLAPDGYLGPCVGRKSFANLNSLEKELWAKVCDVSWPCRQNQERFVALRKLSVKGIFNADCIPDYSAKCPDRWLKSGKLCQAPSDYVGICAFFLDTSEYTQEAKDSFAKACMAPWPCARDVAGAGIR